ncbi:hypothetical protein HRbin13_01386 [bacterium HR13]|nr:hypothetical protein HRbin13_01386 [bacterium HR13]
MKQSQGMYLYVVGNYKFFPGKSHSIIGYKRVLEGGFRVSHIHHNLGFWSWQILKVYLFHLIGYISFVNISYLTFCTGNCYLHTAFEYFCCLVRSHHSRNAQLSCHYGCVCSSSSPIGDYGGCFLHYGFPIRVCNVCHQYLPFLKLSSILKVVYDSNSTCGNLITYSYAVYYPLFLSAFNRLCKLVNFQHSLFFS